MFFSAQISLRIFGHTVTLTSPRTGLKCPTIAHVSIDEDFERAAGQLPANSYMMRDPIVQGNVRIHV